ncbi:hypothetical protein HKL94_00450 [Candidatus Parcubacteria bacterium]|nr:hypothetical protein [Candidatus Parcubacteria bacterium]
MQRVLFSLLALLLLPASAYAARASTSFSSAQALLSASSSPGNVYTAGTSIVVVAPVGGDFSAFGGSVITAAPIAGDELLFAGSIQSRARVGGDFRAMGGSVSVEGPVSGDLIAFGFTVHDSSRAGGSVFVVAANTALTDGARGPVIIYGNNILLGGDFAGNVTIVSSGQVSLSASTTIAGKLSYEAPEEAIIPASATVRGGVIYTNASYLPDVGTSRILSLISIGFFIFVRILGALILAGLLAGLFPRLAEALLERTTTMRPSRVFLTALLGFAVFVVTPVLSLLLALTFVGIGLALLLIIAYALIVLLSLLYAGILLGGLLARRFFRRDFILWHDGVLGMLALSVVTLIPYFGLIIAFLLTIFSAGVLLTIFFHFAFPHEDQEQESI